METIHVEVQPDHLERMSAVRKPILAVAELVWNSLDADATDVRVTLHENAIDGLDTIVVEDNGHGINRSDALLAFKNLGGSWKRGDRRSKHKRRLLHGKAGKGRFRAFALGRDVVWETAYRKNGIIETFTIEGSRLDLGTFAVGEVKEATRPNPGTTVTITNIQKNFQSLYGDAARQEMASYFALYLSQYPDVHIWYDGPRIDPASVQDNQATYDLEPTQLDDGNTVRPQLTIIEWKAAADRSLYLCDEDGFAIAEVPPGIHAPGYVFTAYLKCAIFRDYPEETFALEELHPDLRLLLDSAKAKLRDHFRERSALRAAYLVESWKREKIYPYEGEATTAVERVERQVFDVLALNVTTFLPDFDGGDTQSKRFSFRLLRSALQENPRALQRIISEVLGLPREKQCELAELLETTSLAAIISASKTVADRLDFLRGLEILLFECKDRLRERSELHRLLQERTWVFGEQFSLTLSDRSLTEVLRKHIKLLGRSELCPKPVRREDGSTGIVDLMLSRIVPQARPEEREHLIVELKRPSQAVDLDVVQQVQSYAMAVAEDERFRDTETRWVFWAISNEITRDVRRLASQRNRPPGLLFEDTERPIVIWVKSWGEVLQSCRGRLQFFQEHLQYSPDDDDAVARLGDIYRQYLTGVREGAEGPGAR